MIMPPTFSDTGNRNGKAFQQLANWADQDGTGETFDSSSGSTLPNGTLCHSHQIAKPVRTDEADGAAGWRKTV